MIIGDKVKLVTESMGISPNRKGSIGKVVVIDHDDGTVKVDFGDAKLWVDQKAVRICKDEHHIEVAKANINAWMEHALAEIGSVEKKLQEATTFSEFMCAKQDLYRIMINSIPLQTRHCPYCILKEDTDIPCDECDYGKEHGVCNRIGVENDFHNLTHARNKAMEKVEGYWNAE